MNVDQACWLHLIENGMITESRSHYGVCKDFETTQKIREKVQKEGLSAINWNKTKPIKDGYDYEFAGTFVDPEQIKYIEGLLVLNDGRKYEFYQELDSDWSFKESVQLILDIMKKYEV